MELAAGCAKGVLAETSVRLCSVLGGDTGAISALRILHLYMERLGCDFQVALTPFPAPRPCRARSCPIVSSLFSCGE